MIDSGAQCKIDKLDCIQDRIIHTSEYVYDVDRHENIEVLKIDIICNTLCKKQPYSPLGIRLLSTERVTY